MVLRGEVGQAAVRGMRRAAGLGSVASRVTGRVKLAAGRRAQLADVLRFQLGERLGRQLAAGDHQQQIHGEGRAAYEPTMATAYCRAAGRELRYLAARLLDVSAQPWAERAHAAGRVCAALVEELASARADREPAEVLV